MEYYAQTDIGKKYKHNEDAYALPELSEKYNLNSSDIKNKGDLFVLCDGIGGLNAGEIASELTAKWIVKDYYHLPDGNNFPRELEQIIKSVNTKIYNLSEEHESYQGMGTTAVAVLFYENKTFICSVGDSRVYIFRNKQLIQITEDQSEVWQLYKAGEISKDELRFHPRNNIITMAVGAYHDIDVQRYEHDIKNGDIFLLCSDGLSDMVGDQEIRDILSKKQSAKKIAGHLVDAANNYGGKDNITVIVIKV